MLSVIMLSVIMLSVIMLSVVAPLLLHLIFDITVQDTLFNEKAKNK
jgi:hypothetical protein